MVDYNQALSLAQALERGRALDREGIYWLEEPIRHDDYAGNATLVRELETPIQIGENFSESPAMQAFGVPGELLPLAIAVELGCGLLILCGYHTRATALILAGFCLATAVLFHGKFGDRNQLLHFEKDLAIAGGLLLLFAHGAGAWAIDALRSAAKGGLLAGIRAQQRP